MAPKTNWPRDYYSLRHSYSATSRSKQCTIAWPKKSITSTNKFEFKNSSNLNLLALTPWALTVGQGTLTEREGKVQLTSLN
jgi:hypothetical protein